MSSYNPFKNNTFSRIINDVLSSEVLSDGAKILYTYLGGQFGMAKNGVMDLTLKKMAKATGAKTVLQFDIKTGFIKSKTPTRTTERHLKELKDNGIIDTKKLKHGIQIWFVKQDTTNLTGLFSDDNQDTTNLTNSDDKFDGSRRSDHYIKKKRKESSLPVNFQIQALRFKVPRDKRYLPGCTKHLKHGIDNIGFEDTSSILIQMKSESHTDFFEVFRERIGLN